MTGELRARREQPPAGEAVIVRGGLLDRDELERAARLCHQRFGVYGLSVFRADNEAGIDDLARTRLRRYPVLTLSAAGELRAARLELRPTFRRPHYTVVLDDLGGSIDRLAACRRQVHHNGHYERATARPEEGGTP